MGSLGCAASPHEPVEHEPPTKLTLAVDSMSTLITAMQTAAQWKTCGVEIDAHLGPAEPGECAVFRDDSIAAIASTGVSLTGCTIHYKTSLSEPALTHEVGHALWLRDSDVGVMRRDLNDVPVGGLECALLATRKPQYQ